MANPAFASTTLFCGSVPLFSNILVKILAASGTVSPPNKSFGFKVVNPKCSGRTIFSELRVRILVGPVREISSYPSKA